MFHTVVYINDKVFVQYISLTSTQVHVETPHNLACFRTVGGNQSIQSDPMQKPIWGPKRNFKKDLFKPL